ncbi:hypothetical protein OCD70_28200, partial [Bacillus tropicus]|uniref:hypothetical protein n=2 Tax=Bacillus cereus group TaxID=86661 RepID=UPI0021D1702D
WDLVPVRVGRRQATVRRVKMTRLFCVSNFLLASSYPFVFNFFHHFRCVVSDFLFYFLWKQSIGVLK